MDSKPDLKRGVYRVMHFLVIGGRRITSESDMIFVNGHPEIVLEWTPPGDHPPALTVPLDPARLQARPGPQGYFVYDGDVVDPRTRH